MSNPFTGVSNKNRQYFGVQNGAQVSDTQRSTYIAPKSRPFS